MSPPINLNKDGHYDFILKIKNKEKQKCLFISLD